MPIARCAPLEQLIIERPAVGQEMADAVHPLQLGLAGREDDDALMKRPHAPQLGPQAPGILQYAEVAAVLGSQHGLAVKGMDKLLRVVRTTGGVESMNDYMPVGLQEPLERSGDALVQIEDQAALAWRRASIESR